MDWYEPSDSVLLILVEDAPSATIVEDVGGDIEEGIMDRVGDGDTGGSVGGMQDSVKSEASVSVGDGDTGG